MENSKSGRGGKREGSGRPKGTTGAYKKQKDKIKPRSIKLTDFEYENYLKLGGARWLRPILRGNL